MFIVPSEPKNCSLQRCMYIGLHSHGQAREREGATLRNTTLMAVRTSRGISRPSSMASRPRNERRAVQSKVWPQLALHRWQRLCNSRYLRGGTLRKALREGCLAGEDLDVLRAASPCDLGLQDGAQSLSDLTVRETQRRLTIVQSPDYYHLLSNNHVKQFCIMCLSGENRSAFHDLKALPDKPFSPP